MFLAMVSSSIGSRIPKATDNGDLQPAVVQLITPSFSSTTSQHPMLLLNHHHQMVRGSGCFGIDGQAKGAASHLRRSRWIPTFEQVMALKDMYRCGLKTPTAKQIQLVTAQLRQFGKIESKNVFYWFQNYRARERQKRRRDLMSMQYFTTNSITSCDLYNKGAGGLTKSSVEVEQQNDLKLSISCAVTSDQESSIIVQERRMMKMVDSDSSGKVVKQSYSPEVEEEYRDIRTLELFPLTSDDIKGANCTLMKPNFL